MTAKSKAKEVNAVPASKFVLPDGFVFPEMPIGLSEGLEDAIRDVIKEYLPPEWSEVITDYVVMYSIQPGDVGNSVADYAGWVDNFQRLQMFLAGVRYDETGHWTEWVGPAPKLGKKASE